MVSARLKNRYPSGSEVRWTDADGEWIGWRLPEGITSPHAVPLPSGGVAIRDVGVSLVKSAGEVVVEAKAAKIAANVDKWRAEIVTLLAIPKAEITEAQKERRNKLVAKLSLSLGLDGDD